MDVVGIGIVALLVVGYGLVSARLSSTMITAPMVFVTAGVLLSSEAIDLIDFGLEQSIVEGLIEFTLTLILFTDATRIDLRELRADAALPGRLLGIGLPLTVVAGGGAALILFPDLSLSEAALLGAMLAPTDAALGQAVVTSTVVPVRIRQTLNVESGLNDGIALPLVTVLLALASAEIDPGNPGFWAEFAAKQIGFGVLAGVVVGGAGAFLLDRASRRGWVDGTYQQLGTLALAIAAWAAAGSLDGNGFIAAFVGGGTFGLVARSHCEHVSDFTEDEGQLLTMLTFLVFGGAFVAPTLGKLNWQIIVYAVLSLTAVRMAPVALSLYGSRLRPPTVGFVGWFGPRGLASILFLVIVIEEGALGSNETLIHVVTMTVLLSVFAHGMTANPAARAYGRWSEAMAEERPGMPEHDDMHEHAVRVRHPGQLWRHRRRAVRP